MPRWHHNPDPASLSDGRRASRSLSPIRAKFRLNHRFIGDAGTIPEACNLHGADGTADRFCKPVFRAVLPQAKRLILLGGRTRTRTLNPLIKRQRVRKECQELTPAES